MLRSAKALLAGDMPAPNDTLKVEWFYMSFHQEDHIKYLKSGKELCDKTLETVAKYFDNIYNAQVADSLLTKKREKQIKFRAKRELCHKMAKHYNKKIRNLANQRYRHGDRRHKLSPLHHQNYDKKYIRRDHDDHRGHNHAYKCDNKDRKSLPKSDDKAFKRQPCHIHGPKSQHSFKKCFKNPKNQDKKFYNKKRTYEVHQNNERHVSEDKESPASMDLPPPSVNSHTLPSEDEQECKEEQYHVQFDKNVKAGS